MIFSTINIIKLVLLCRYIHRQHSYSSGFMSPLCIEADKIDEEEPYSVFYNNSRIDLRPTDSEEPEYYFCVPNTNLEGFSDFLCRSLGFLGYDSYTKIDIKDQKKVVNFLESIWPTSCPTQGRFQQISLRNALNMSKIQTCNSNQLLYVECKLTDYYEAKNDISKAITSLCLPNSPLTSVPIGTISIRGQKVNSRSNKYLITWADKTNSNIEYLICSDFNNPTALSILASGACNNLGLYVANVTLETIEGSIRMDSLVSSPQSVYDDITQSVTSIPYETLLKTPNHCTEKPMRILFATCLARNQRISVQSTTAFTYPTFYGSFAQSVGVNEVLSLFDTSTLGLAWSICVVCSEEKVNEILARMACSEQDASVFWSAPTDIILNWRFVTLDPVCFLKCGIYNVYQCIRTTPCTSGYVLSAVCSTNPFKHLDFTNSLDATISQYNTCQYQAVNIQFMARDCKGPAVKRECIAKLYDDELENTSSALYSSYLVTTFSQLDAILSVTAFRNVSQSYYFSSINNFIKHGENAYANLTAYFSMSILGRSFPILSNPVGLIETMLNDGLKRQVGYVDFFFSDDTLSKAERAVYTCEDYVCTNPMMSCVITNNAPMCECPYVYITDSSRNECNLGPMVVTLAVGCSLFLIGMIATCIYLPLATYLYVSRKILYTKIVYDDSSDQDETDEP